MRFVKLCVICPRLLEQREAWLQKDPRLVNGRDHELGSIRKRARMLCNEEKAQALIEYILMLPLIFLLIINLVNIGGFFFAWITVANAARVGVNYAILGGASVGFASLGQATVAQITGLISQDVASLPNQSSLTVNICQNANGTVTTLSGSCNSVPADAEPTIYTLESVDVTYTYQPFIPASFQFQGLGIYLTIPPTTVHRRAVMRMIE